LWLILFVLPGGCPLSSAAEPSSSIRDTVAALEEIRYPGPEGDLPYGVPEAARPLLTQLKHQLRHLILSALNAPQNQVVDAGHLTDDVLKELDREGVPVGEKKLPKSQEYGGILGVEITQPKGNPELLAATTTLRIPCAMEGDTSLYIFKREAARWKLLIAVESDDYAQVNGAQDYFGYAISPKDQQGDWYVVTAHIPGWCTSCWGGVHYQVLRPGLTMDAPRVLLNKDEGIYRCGEPPCKLALEPGGFRIDYVAGEWLDFDLFATIQADRYVVSGDHVTRVAPVAYTPQDFLNAWTQMPWSEARQWSNPAQVSSLESWHGRLDPSSDKGYLTSSKFEFVQPCNNSPTKWQIGLIANRWEAESPHLFFTVSMKGDAFNLEGIDLERPPGCPGEAPASKTLHWEQVEQLRAH
jgi:hypothetical protein